MTRILILTTLLVSGACAMISTAQAQLLRGPLYSVYFYPNSVAPAPGNGVGGRALLWLGNNDQWNAVCAPPQALAPGGALGLHDSTGDASAGVTFTYPPLYLTGKAVDAPCPFGDQTKGAATEGYDAVYRPASGPPSGASTFAFSGLAPGGWYDLVVYRGIPGCEMSVSVNGGAAYPFSGAESNHGGWTYVGRTYHASLGVTGPTTGNYIEVDDVVADKTGKLTITLAPTNGTGELDVMGFQLETLSNVGHERADGLRLPAVFSDHAVLQAAKPIVVWGWANPGTNVAVSFDRDNGPAEQFKTQTGNDGRWSGQLPALPSGVTGHFEVQTDQGDPIKVSDVVVGEVWLGSGQSNMDYKAITTERGAAQNTTAAMNAETKQEAAAAQGNIRYFLTHIIRGDVPLDDVQGRWIVATPDTVADAYAVTWNFAVALREKLHVPVGLLDSAVGGTNVQFWTPRPELDASLLGPSNDGHFLQQQAQFNSAMAAWLKSYPTHELQEQNLASKPVFGPVTQNVPGCLYNGMINGLVPYAMQGVLWFQGDANENSWWNYGPLMKLMITSWRKHWNDDAITFYYVELQNWNIPQTQPVEYNARSLVREQQQEALELPRTGVATSVDLGIVVPPGKVALPHFPNKKPLGQRLANLALNDVYGFPGKVHSPQFKSFDVEGNKIRLKFDYADGLRVRGGGDLKGFAIRAANGMWYWAQGSIEGQDILLWNDQVPNPADVRYGWAMNPILSVENDSSLPLRPFRTDIGDKQ